MPTEPQNPTQSHHPCGGPAPWAWPLVALAAWCVPGLGHWLTGCRRRGQIVGVTLALMFVAGMVIVGIDVVDRRRDTLWFAGQAMFGPAAFAADYAHRRLDAARDRQVEQYAGRHNLSTRDGEAMQHLLEHSADPPVYRTSIGRVNEVGTLYCTLAGILNLLAILDAIGRSLSKVQRSKVESPQAARPEAQA